LALREAAEFAKDDHADLLLDGLSLGKRDGLTVTQQSYVPVEYRRTLPVKGRDGLCLEV
jgi:hypothetical protein